MGAYRVKEGEKLRVFAADNIGEAVQLTNQLEDHFFKENSTFAQICQVYHQFVQNPETLEQKVSSVMSARRQEIIRTIQESVPQNGILGVQEFVGIAVSQAQREIYSENEDPEKNKEQQEKDLLTLSKSINDAIGAQDLSSEINFNTVEGQRLAFDLLQKFIEVLNDPEHPEILLRDVLGEDYVESDQYKLARDLLCSPKLMSWLSDEMSNAFGIEKNTVTEEYLPQEHSSSLAYFLTALKYRIELQEMLEKEAEGNRRAELMYYTKELLYVQKVLELLPKTQREAVKNLLFQHPLNPHLETGKKILSVVNHIIIGLLAITLIANLEYVKVLAVGSLSIFMVNMVLGFIYDYKLTNNLSSYADVARKITTEYSLEKIDPKIVHLYKILRKLFESMQKVQEFTKNKEYNSLEFRATVTEIRVLNILLESFLQGNSAPEATIKVGKNTQIVLGKAAIEAELASWGINIGTDAHENKIFTKLEREKRLATEFPESLGLPGNGDDPLVDALAAEQEQVDLEEEDRRATGVPWIKR